MRFHITYPDGTTEERHAGGRVIRMGRDAACEVAFDAVRFPKVSGFHAEIEMTPSGLVLTHKSQSNKTLLNDRPLNGSVALKIGDRVRLGITGPAIELLEDSPAVEFANTIQADASHLALLRGTAESERFEVGNGGMIGRDSMAQFILDHPHVSRFHAQLADEDGRIVLTDLGSANGTYVNGRRLEGPIELSRGNRIDIGPFSLGFDGGALISRSRANNIELAARGLTRVVTDRATGEPLTLIDEVSLVVRPREFVCLLGPSGSGKSTLLAMLSGRAAPDAGMILVNGRDLHSEFAAHKQDIAVVPQREALHDGLTIGAALRYTAELRLPPDISREEILAAVADLLEVVGLSHRSSTQIRHLSGGQLKRASLANELISRPSLLFLDEVTSGLDEQTDREVMEVFRKVSEIGKTVVCITHNLANVEAACHLVAILTEGGRLAFVGTPAEARRYFGIERLGDVYKALAGRPPDEWKALFQSHPLYARYVRDRLPPDLGDRDAIAPGIVPDSSRTTPLRQAWVLTRRYLSIWRGDVPALAAMLGQSLLVAIMIAIVFGDVSSIENPVERTGKTISLLFLLNVSCFWLGCNNAAKELVKERVIYTRERDFNLRADGYLASKFLVLLFIGLIQMSLLFGVVRLFCSPAGGVVQQWAMLAMLAAAGTSLGLLISAAARNEEMAIALVPIAVIPQIILAGAIAPVSGLAKALALGIVTCHWGQRGLEAGLPAVESVVKNVPARDPAVQLLVVTGHMMAFTVLAFLILGGRAHRTKN